VYRILFALAGLLTRCVMPRVWQAIARRPQIVKATPDIAFGAIGKQMGEEWRGMSDADKAPYQAKADKAKAKYEKEKAKYGESRLSLTQHSISRELWHRTELRCVPFAYSRRCQEEMSVP
jgi:hypothetical protein